MKYKLVLSEKDQYVPDNYASITEIFTNPEYALPGYDPETWCLGEKRLKEMRTKTFAAVKKRFDYTQLKKFDSYWNHNLDAINQLGLNEFAKLSCFIELASVMMAFEERIEMSTRKGKRKVISFGIKKDLYKKYSDSLKEAIETGQEPKKVKLYERKKKLLNDIFESSQKTTLCFEAGENGRKRYVEIDKNSIFLAFEQWCKLKGKTKKRGIYDAMLLMMQTNPADGLGDIKAYARTTDIDRQEVIVLDESREDVGKFFKCPLSLSKKMIDIVGRYNSDQDNIVNEKLTERVFIINAISFYIKHLPLKYTDPVAYKEYTSIKEAEKYNQEIMDGNK